MSAKIEEIIPEQGFELVLNIIGVILTTELENQKELQNLDDPLNIYNSRSTPFGQSEELMINVSYDGVNYDQETQSCSKGQNRYNVDVHVSSKETSSSKGGANASLKLNKYMGMIRYILSSSKYKNLMITPGVISNRKVSSIDSFDDVRKQDSSFTKTGRIVYEVTINESQDMAVGVELTSTETDVKLGLTQLGYKYQYNKI